MTRRVVFPLLAVVYAVSWHRMVGSTHFWAGLPAEPSLVLVAGYYLGIIVVTAAIMGIADSLSRGFGLYVLIRHRRGMRLWWHAVAQAGGWLLTVLGAELFVVLTFAVSSQTALTSRWWLGFGLQVLALALLCLGQLALEFRFGSRIAFLAIQLTWLGEVVVSTLVANLRIPIVDRLFIQNLTMLERGVPTPTELSWTLGYAVLLAGGLTWWARRTLTRRDWL